MYSVDGPVHASNGQVDPGPTVFATKGGPRTSSSSSPVSAGRFAALPFDHARAERLRQERLTAYSAYAGAITEPKRSVVNLWFRRQEDPDGAEYLSATVECDRLGALAEHAQFRMRLITDVFIAAAAAQLR